MHFCTPVVVGREPKGICSDVAFTEAERLKNQWELVVDLGEIYTFNHLQFDINPNTREPLVEIFYSDTYSVGTSPDKTKWEFLICIANNLVGISYWICEQRSDSTLLLFPGHSQIYSHLRQ